MTKIKYSIQRRWYRLVSAFRVLTKDSYYILTANRADELMIERTNMTDECVRNTIYWLNDYMQNENRVMSHLEEILDANNITTPTDD